MFVGFAVWVSTVAGIWVLAWLDWGWWKDWQIGGLVVRRRWLVWVNLVCDLRKCQVRGQLMRVASQLTSYMRTENLDMGERKISGRDMVVLAVVGC
jgi:hypothetical protein